MKEYIDAESELGQSSQADLEQLFERVRNARLERNMAWDDMQDGVESLRLRMEQESQHVEDPLEYAETKDDELMRFLAFEDSVEDYAEDSVEDTNEQPAGTIPDRTRTRYASV